MTISRDGLERIGVLNTAKFHIDTNGSGLTENSIVILGIYIYIYFLVFFFLVFKNEIINFIILLIKDRLTKL